MKFEKDKTVNLNFQPTEISTLAPHAEPPVNLFASVHRALRGRYLWAGALATVLGAAGTIVGFNLTEPLYTSNGLVEVLSKITPILRDINETAKLDAFDSVVSAQADYIGSARVLMHAANKSDKMSGWPPGAKGLSLLQASLNVSRKRGQRIIHVDVTHQDPTLAKNALDAILDSYMEIYGDDQSQSVTAREQFLRVYQTSLVDKINGARREIAGFTEIFGTSNLDPLRDATFTEILEINRRIAEVEQRLISARAKAEPKSANEKSTDPSAGDNDTAESSADDTTLPEIYSIENLCSVDPRLADLVADRNNLQASLEASRLDYGPAHFKIRSLQRALEQVKSQINVRLAEIHTLIENGQLNLIENNLINDTQSVEALEAMQRQYLALAAAKQKRLKDINTTRAKILAEQEELDRNMKYLDEATSEIDAIELESKHLLNVGRINISYGWVPTEPSKDRRKPLAILGGGAGVGLGISVIWLFGFLRPAYRYIDELEDSPRQPLIGTLPDLNDPQPEQMAVASLSIHHLRNMLSLRSGIHHRDNAVTYMITSARAGDGKTSITLALGMSFASEGMRTLLLDLDLVGRGLSRSLEQNQSPGFVDILGTDNISGQIQSTQVNNLWLIPIGTNSACRPEELPAGEIRRILEILQNDFDVILIDTGPLMGSLEANVAASIVDETILVVSHGQKPRIVEAALDRLEQIGGKCAGIVFNRANRSDLTHSISQGSFHSQSIREPATPNPQPTNQGPQNPHPNGPRALALAIMESTGTENMAPTEAKPTENTQPNPPNTD